jgi:hypothetical protein
MATSLAFTPQTSGCKRVWSESLFVETTPTWRSTLPPLPFSLRRGAECEPHFWARRIYLSPAFGGCFLTMTCHLCTPSMAMNKIALTKKMLVSLDRMGIVKRKLWKTSPS